MTSNNNKKSLEPEIDLEMIPENSETLEVDLTVEGMFKQSISSPKKSQPKVSAKKTSGHELLNLAMSEKERLGHLSQFLTLKLKSNSELNQSTTLHSKQERENAVLKEQLVSRLIGVDSSLNKSLGQIFDSAFMVQVTQLDVEEPKIPEMILDDEMKKKPKAS